MDVGVDKSVQRVFHAVPKMRRKGDEEEGGEGGANHPAQNTAGVLNSSHTAGRDTFSGSHLIYEGGKRGG